MLTKQRLMQIIKEEVEQALGQDVGSADDMFSDLEDTSATTDVAATTEPEVPEVDAPEEDEAPEFTTGIEDEVDHEAIADCTATASKILSALEDFEDSASPDMQNAVSSELAKMKEALLDMVMEPGKYCKTPKLDSEET